MNKPLKLCPFCKSVAKRTGGTIGDITINSCRCSNRECIASFTSVDYDVWNTRPEGTEQTTVLKWLDDEDTWGSGFKEAAE